MISAGRTHRSTIAGVVVAVATLASVVVRVRLARQVHSPFIFQDEFGYVAVSRLLVGQAPTLYGPTYFPGLGVLLAPAAAILEPGGTLRAAQLLNAVAASAVIPAAYLVARRVAGLGPWLAAGAAIVGACSAASLLVATMLLPEALLLLAVTLLVLAVHETVRRAGVVPAALTGTLAGVCYAIHPRSVVIVLAVLVTVGVAWRAGALPGRPALAVGAGALGTMAVVQVVHAWTTREMYEVGTLPSLAGSPLDAVTEPAGVALITAGQVWYVTVATVGLYPLGVVAAVVLARSGLRGPDPPSAGAVTALFVVLGVAGSLALGSAASHQVGAGLVNRADQPIYGRYVEQWVPVLVVLAPTVARRLAVRTVAVVAVATAALGAIVSAGYPGAVWDLPLAWTNIASMRLAFDWFGPDYVAAAGVSAAVVTAVALGTAAAVSRPAVWAFPLGVFLVLNVVAGATLVEDWAGPASRAWGERHALGPPLVAADVPVAIDVDFAFGVAYAYNLQFWEPDVEVVFIDEPITTGLQIARKNDPPTPGARLIGTEANGPIGLWALDPATVAHFGTPGPFPGATDDDQQSTS